MPSCFYWIQGACQSSEQLQDLMVFVQSTMNAAFFLLIFGSHAITLTDHRGTTIAEHPWLLTFSSSSRLQIRLPSGGPFANQAVELWYILSQIGGLHLWLLS
jgi:hypothetical protein